MQLHFGVEIDTCLEYVPDVGGLDFSQRQSAIVPRTNAGVDEVQRKDAAEVTALAAVRLCDGLIGGDELEEPEFCRQLGQLTGAGNGRFQSNLQLRSRTGRSGVEVETVGGADAKADIESH